MPTGSMAPTLLGHPQEIVCPNCAIRFALGMDDEGRAGRPVCPNCGQAELDSVRRSSATATAARPEVPVRLPPPAALGGRRLPYPGRPVQAYVKRVVGLPGETVQIVGGDVYIDGRIARKTLPSSGRCASWSTTTTSSRATPTRYPRWTFRRGRRSAGVWPSGWQAEGSRFVHEPTDDRRPTAIDWIEYRHWDPDAAGYGPIRDFIAYNGGDVRGENVVHDLMLEARSDLRARRPAI